MKRIKSKVISNFYVKQFEKELDEFLNGLSNYSIQYRTVFENPGVRHLALILYEVNQFDEPIRTTAKDKLPEDNRTCTVPIRL